MSLYGSAPASTPSTQRQSMEATMPSRPSADRARTVSHPSLFPDGSETPLSTRLEELLDIRYNLARLAGELRSHGMPELREAERRLATIETLIGEIYPSVLLANLPRWLLQDEEELTHALGRRNDNCRICRFVAGLEEHTATHPLRLIA